MAAALLLVVTLGWPDLGVAAPGDPGVGAPVDAATAGQGPPAATRGPGVALALRELADRPTVSRWDCLRVVACLLDGKWLRDDAAWLETSLTAQGIAGRNQLERLSEPASRAYASLLFCRAMRERRGVLRRLFGWSEFVAYRHLEQLDMVPSGGPWTRVSGAELVGLFTIARRRLRLLERAGGRRG